MRTAAALLLLLGSTPAAAQEGALDVLDGETLFDGGWLFSIAEEISLRSTWRDGRDRVSDPLDRERRDLTTVLSAHYGLRHDLQVGAILSHVRRSLEGDGPDLESSGPGDATVYAKWRFKRWDGPGWSNNLSVLAGLDLPTGASGERDGGVRLPPDLQPGTGALSPFLGVATTYEPGRWRFNAFALVQRRGAGAQDFNEGDEFHAEVAAGNRFWLEPYPGPFMRADVSLRYHREGRDHQGGGLVGDSGSERWSVQVNWAFRPRPVLDFQASVEHVLLERVGGVQLGAGTQILLSFGYRI